MKGWKLSCVLGLGWLSACAVEATDDADDLGEDVAMLSEELSRNALSKKQEKTALKAIDDICGDTWCEGDHNFSFDRLECQKGCQARPGSCKLTFRVFSYDTDLETGPTYTRTCRTPGFTGFESLVETYGDYHALVPAYYDALTQCIGEVEDSLPR